MPAICQFPTHIWSLTFGMNYSLNNIHSMEAKHGDILKCFVRIIYTIKSVIIMFANLILSVLIIHWWFFENNF